ncbi:MAG: DNA polymerase III subunit beta [Gammaproteobacteria bacterium]|jgi:DNA polymerase-3 subunit beta|nr:DNA polymerase III subunit beta [Gammaproteobacteria bacterium]
MQFTIHREALLKPLQRVQGALERRQTLPILANILVVVKNQLLSLTGTDLEIEMIARVPLSNPAQSGATTIPGKKLIDICKALPEHAQISIEAADNKVVVRSGRSRYSIACLPAENFPKVEESPGDVELSVKQSVLRQLLDVTCFAMAHQDVRYYLNGVLMAFNQEEVRTVATDGHRLATMALPVRSHLTHPLAVIVPRKAVTEMQRLFQEGDEEIGLVIGKNHLRAVTTHTSFVTKLIEGKFPDYQRVLPQDPPHQFEVSRELLKQALLRVSVLFTDKYRGVGLMFTSNLLRIIATTPDKDEVEDEVEIAYQGPAIEIGANASYLIEYLNIVKSDMVKVAFTSPNHVILFETALNEAEPQAKHSYVVMPMRL